MQRIPEALAGSARQRGARRRRRHDHRKGLGPARSAYAAKTNEGTRQVIADIKTSGIDTLVRIAKALQARGVRIPRGSIEWQLTQVARLQQSWLKAGAAESSTSPKTARLGCVGGGGLVSRQHWGCRCRGAGAR